MKKIKTLAKFTFTLIEAWFGCLKDVWTDKTLYWSVNETFFRGKDAEENRARFVKDYKQLVEDYRESFINN